MYRLGVCVNLCGGLAHTGQRAEIKIKAADIGSGHLLFDGLLGKFQSKILFKSHYRCRRGTDL